jgi:hypothetical protein
MNEYITISKYTPQGMLGPLRAVICHVNQESTDIIFKSVDNTPDILNTITMFECYKCAKT